MVRANLKVPRIAHKGKFEQRLIKIVRQHFLGSDRLGVSRKLDAHLMVYQSAELTGDPYGRVVGVSPSMFLKCSTNARATCFRYVNEKELFLVR